MYGTGNLAASLLHNKSTSTSQFHASQQCDNRFVEMEKQLQEEREQRQRLEEEVRATKEMMKRSCHSIRVALQVMIVEILRNEFILGIW